MLRRLVSLTALPQKLMSRNSSFGQPSAMTSVDVSDKAQQKDKSKWRREVPAEVVR